jgi:hypothetical protein
VSVPDGHLRPAHLETIRVEGITKESVLAAVRVLLALTGLALLICVANPAPSPARASVPNASTATGKRPIPAPGVFRLQASNGYTLVAFGVPAHEGHPGVIELILTKKQQRVTYTAPATVTETSIQANLGELGEISVTFQPTGQPRNVRPRCGGGSVSVESGSYEGKIAFHGEEGYTELDATSAPGDISILLNVFCGVLEGGGRGGGPLLGAELHIRNPQLGPELSVAKKRPAAPAEIYVGVSEYKSGISIARVTSLFMPAGRFRYDPRLQTATLHPPAPFAGTGRFDRSKKGSKRWSGDLTVDMPGRENVPLTGPALRATLIPR